MNEKLEVLSSCDMMHGSVFILLAGQVLIILYVYPLANIEQYNAQQ